MRLALGLAAGQGLSGAVERRVDHPQARRPLFVLRDL